VTKSLLFLSDNFPGPKKPANMITAKIEVAPFRELFHNRLDSTV